MKLKGRIHRLGFVVLRNNEWCAVYAGGTTNVYMNPATVHGWIKKQVVSWMNKRNEMWWWRWVNWILFIATSKERNKKWQTKWPTSKFETSTKVSCVYQKYRKMEVWVLLGVQFVGHVSCLWWDRVCDICKFRSARTSIKEVISALPCGIFCFTVKKFQVRESQDQ